MLFDELQLKFNEGKFVAAVRQRDQGSPLRVLAGGRAFWSERPMQRHKLGGGKDGGGPVDKQSGSSILSHV